MTGFDWDVIERSLPYLFREGMTFTLTLTKRSLPAGKYRVKVSGLSGKRIELIYNYDMRVNYTTAPPKPQ